MDDTRLLNLNEAAKFLDLSKDAAYTQLRLKRLPYFKIGRHLRFRRSDLEAFLERCRVEPAKV